MKDNNKTVNDIFQNDNGNKNKTKTILLLTIVAIILIAVFLIVAWVMTRDNPLQESQKDQEQAAKTAIEQPSERPVPYAHNMENENPFGIDTSKGMTGVPANGGQNRPDSTMSNIPPVVVPTNNATAPTSDNKYAEKGDDLEKDEKYRAVLKDLEKQHSDKKNAEAKKDDSPKKEKAQAKVVVPPVPKETTIATALDPTKSSQKPKSSEKKDSEKSTQKSAKEQAKPAESKKPSTTTQNAATQNAKDSEKPVAKQQTKSSETNSPNKEPNQDKVIHRPQNNIVSENQGKAPEKGHYVQVGAFTDQDKITPEFLNKISKYSYRVLKVEQPNGTTSVKYLIGPYKTREEVKQIETKIRTEINQGSFYVDRTK